ncbi:MAG TPA: DMT family transporter, partial [Sphingomonas sp.]|nr:DMT family transporter [Sphingomonas sp.]
GVGLLFLNEVRQSAAAPAAVAIGIGLTLLGVLSASVSNVMQASARMRARPIASMLAWGMLYGTLVNALFGWARYGPPVFEARLGYVAGIVYLGVFASAIAFPLYYSVLRVIGPAKAAYSSVIVPVIAMLLSTLFEGYRWSPLAVAGAVLTGIGLVVALRARRPAR